MEYSVGAMIGLPALIFIFFMIMVIKQYKRCPSNKILVIFGKVSGERTAKCIHGGGAFVLPLIQDYAYMTLEPKSIDINLTSALSKKNIRVDVPSTFTVGISTQAEIIEEYNLDTKEMEFLKMNLYYGHKCRRTFINVKGFTVGTPEYKRCVLRKGRKD